MLANTKILVSVFAGFALFTSTQIHAFEWPSFPEPPQSDVKWMIRDTRINGLPMKIKVFRSEIGPAKVLGYYRKKWNDGFAEDQQGPWKQISRIDKRYMYLVQVQPDNKGSWGRLSVTNLTDIKKPLAGNGIPMMRNSKILSDMADGDTGWSGRTVGLMNDYSLTSNWSFYNKHYSNRGWQSYMEQSPTKTEKVLVFRQGSEDVNIVLFEKNGQTHVLHNRVHRKMIK